MNMPLGVETQSNPIYGNIEDALPLFTWIEGFTNQKEHLYFLVVKLSVSLPTQFFIT
jgi:hypothetical protein